MLFRSLARWLVVEGIVGADGVTVREGQSPGETETAHAAQGTVPSRTVPDEARQSLADQAETAARLCKADLVTGMVGEFPELQGIMGGYYARHQTPPLPDAVADAIRDHYKPVGQGDDVPTAPVTVAVSLADKLDTIVSYNLAKEFATGSKDPFALRRAALSAISIILENQLRLSLRPAIMQAWQLAVMSWNKTIADPNRQDAVNEFLQANEQAMPEHDWATFMAGARPGFMDDVEGNSFVKTEAFFADRLKVQQREAGVRHDLIDAVFALGGEDDRVSSPTLNARFTRSGSFTITPSKKASMGTRKLARAAIAPSKSSASMATAARGSAVSRADFSLASTSLTSSC